jgi:hypothetical protein
VGGFYTIASMSRHTDYPMEPVVKDMRQPDGCVPGRLVGTYRLTLRAYREMINATMQRVLREKVLMITDEELWAARKARARRWARAGGTVHG